MKFKLEAFVVIACSVAIAVGLVWSIALLFWHSPAMGIVGCAVLASSATATHRVLGR